jgi:4-azaleucine resistance transporter AzlC
LDTAGPSARSEFLAGIQAQAPLMVGVIPFGFIYGALAIQLHVPAPISQAMSSVVFGGSSQFIAAPLIAASAPAIVIILTVFVVNLRHALYSASVAPYLEALHPLWKMLLAYLLTDEAYAIAIAHYTAGGSLRNKHWFLFGTGLMLWTCWQFSTAVGIFVGAQVPANWSLDFALPLTFIALVVPMLKKRTHVLAALVAGVTGVLANGLPYKLGLMLAALLGIVAGMVAEGLDSSTAGAQTASDVGGGSQA